MGKNIDRYRRAGNHLRVRLHRQPQLDEIKTMPVNAGAKNTHKLCLFSSVPKAIATAPTICKIETNVCRMCAIAINVTCKQDMKRGENINENEFMNHKKI